MIQSVDPTRAVVRNFPVPSDLQRKLTVSFQAFQMHGNSLEKATEAFIKYFDIFGGLLKEGSVYQTFSRSLGNI